jgi:hypothetical protein
MDKFEKYFILVKNESKNFKKITPELIQKIPWSILILRLVCNLTHLKLTEEYKKRYGKNVRFTPYEYNKENIGKKIASRLSEIFQEYLPNKVEYSEIRQKFLKIKEYNAGRHGIAKDFEEKVIKILNSYGIKFERNVSIMGKTNVPIDVDIVIPSKTNPKIAIECKIVRGLSGHYSFYHSRAMVLNSIELSYKKIKYVAVIGGDWTPNSLKLLENYCTVVKEDNLNELKEVILEYL